MTHQCNRGINKPDSFLSNAAFIFAYPYAKSCESINLLSVLKGVDFERITIVIKRGSCWVGRFRSYQMVLGRETIGVIIHGEKRVRITKKTHELKRMIDWYNSNSLNTTHADDVRLKLECGSHLGVKSFLSHISYIQKTSLWLNQSD